MVMRPTSCRVVSAEAKTKPQHEPDHVRIAGVLNVVGIGQRYTVVREGQLVIYEDECPSGHPVIRIPLKCMHLLPAGTGLAFTLVPYNDPRPTPTFQAKSDEDYERWVKTLAAELMRQTPLEAVRFLDILGITGALRRTQSVDNLGSWHEKPDVTASSTPTPFPEATPRFRKRTDLPDVVRDLPPVTRKSRSKRRESRVAKLRGQSVDALHRLSETENEVSELIDRCQRSDVYVPVKEKRILFESLFKKKENIALSPERGLMKAHSLHDLSTASLPPCTFSPASEEVPPFVAVKEMCRYFEQRTTVKPLGEKHLNSQSLDIKPDLDILGSTDKEETRSRKPFRISAVKIRHHSNAR